MRRDKTDRKEMKRLKISVKPTLTIYNENEIQWNGRVEKGIVKKCLSGARRMTRGQTAGVNASQRMNYARWRSRDSLFLQDGCQWWYSALVTASPPLCLDIYRVLFFLWIVSFVEWFNNTNITIGEERGEVHQGWIVSSRSTHGRTFSFFSLSLTLRS